MIDSCLLYALTADEESFGVADALLLTDCIQNSEFRQPRELFEMFVGGLILFVLLFAVCFLVLWIGNCLGCECAKEPAEDPIFLHEHKPSRRPAAAFLPFLFLRPRKT